MRQLHSICEHSDEYAQNTTQDYFCDKHCINTPKPVTAEDNSQNKR
jgi:hypothetical protein